MFYGDLKLILTALPRFGRFALICLRESLWILVFFSGFTSLRYVLFSQPCYYFYLYFNCNITTYMLVTDCNLQMVETALHDDSYGYHYIVDENKTNKITALLLLYYQHFIQNIYECEQFQKCLLFSTVPTV